jgi:hypothetical protein
MLDCCRRHKFIIKAFMCNTQYFYTVDSYMYFNLMHRKQCCISTALTVTRTHHNVTLYPTILPILLYRYFVTFHDIEPVSCEKKFEVVSQAGQCLTRSTYLPFCCVLLKRDRLCKGLKSSCHRSL